MFVRNRIPDLDDPYLIDIAVKYFTVDAEKVRKIFEENKVLVICNKNNRIVGFLCYQFVTNDKAKIEYFVIDKNYRGKGIGSSIVPFFIEHARKKGIKEITGVVYNTNTEAYKIFMDWGFRRVANLEGAVLISKII